MAGLIPPLQHQDPDQIALIIRQLGELTERQRLTDLRHAASQVLQRQRFEQHDYKIDALEKNRVTVIRNCAIAGGKIAFKLGGKEVAFQLGKVFSVEIAKKSSFIAAAKAIPVVSVVVGVGLAIHRISKGYSSGDREEYAKAAGEFASGIFACFPGLGTGASVALDACVVSHDIYRGLHPIMPDMPASEITLQEAYEGLGVMNAHREPTKDEVDVAFRNFSQAVHPDHHENAEEYAALQKFVNNCKDTIYHNRNWA